MAVSHLSPLRSVPCRFANQRLIFTNTGPGKFYVGGTLGDRYRYSFRVNIEVGVGGHISYPIPVGYPRGQSCYYLFGQRID